jgi:membrane-associated phospholipid phosphatase
MTLIDGAAPALHSFAMAHSWLTPVVVWGTAGALILCPIGFLAMFFWELRLRPGVAGLLGLVLTQVVCHELGRVTYQARPFVALHFTPLYPHVPNNSFPSSLTAFAAVAAVVGVLAWRRLGTIFVAGTLVVGFGCVYVGVHYPSDVFVGAGVGVACGWVTWLLAGGRPVTRVLGAIERRLPKRRRSMASVPAGPRPRDLAPVATGAR